MSLDKDYKPQGQSRTTSRHAETEEALFVDSDTGVDAAREDREAAQSELTGHVPQNEINDLRGASGGEETSGRTRGIKNDAMRQDREVDGAVSNLPNDKF